MEIRGPEGIVPGSADNQQESSILCDIGTRAGRLGKDQSKAVEEVQAKEKTLALEILSKP